MIEPTIQLKENWKLHYTPSDDRKFDEIIMNFSDQLLKLTDTSVVISVNDYFGKSGVGKVASRKLLTKMVPQLEIDEDFKGIYLFWKNKEPFYTGISRGVIKRIHQHVKGTSHFTSSLCYTLGKEHHKELLNVKHTGTRKELDFKQFSEPFKKILNEHCQVSLLPIESSIELYLFEVYVAVELDLHYYNKFDTH